MKLENYIVNINSSLKNIFESFNITWNKFCLVEKKGIIIWVISDWDIIKSICKNVNLNIDIKNIINYNFIYLKESKYNNQDILNIFLKNNILFIPIIKENWKIHKIILKEKFYEDVLLQDSIKDDNIKNIFPRPWWFYKSIYLSNFARSKIICVNPNQRLSLQKHNHREEHWIIINWTWEIDLEDSKKTLGKWDYFFIPKWTKHRIKNTSNDKNLYFVEVQLWDYFWEDDIIRYSDDYNRVI